MQFDWSTVDTVLLDMDGTLLDLHFDNYFWRELVPHEYASARGLVVEEALRIVEAQYQRVYGTLDWYCVDYWTDALGLDIRGLKAGASDRVCYLPDAEQFLDGMRALGKRLVLVTNAHQDALAIKLHRTDLSARVDRVISSHELNYPKEHAEFWQNLQAREPFHRERTLLIEDSLPVLESARRFGMGHLVAIRRPDTSAPPRVIDGFPAVDSVADLLA
ncbi:MAG: GMP/IMP nucleotidase [Gammaproteobacteria bacterium]